MHLPEKPAMEHDYQQLEQGSQPVVDYKEKYHALKRKLKVLLYEQETFLNELEKAQRKLIRASRDKSFLLDRLLIYEQVTDESSDDSDATLSSDCESGIPPKRRNVITTSKSEPHTSSNLSEGSTQTDRPGRQINKAATSTPIRTNVPVVKIELPESVEEMTHELQNGADHDVQVEVKQEASDTSLNASDVERLSSSVAENSSVPQLDPFPTTDLPQDVFE